MDHHTITLDADQVDLIEYALQDYITLRGPRAAAKLRLDYGVDDPADMDVETLVAACAAALYEICRASAVTQDSQDQRPETPTADDYRNGIGNLQLEQFGISLGRTNVLKPFGHLLSVPDADLPGLYAKAQADAVALADHDASYPGCDVIPFRAPRQRDRKSVV